MGEHHRGHEAEALRQPTGRQRREAGQHVGAEEQHPQALLVIHPECPPEIQDLADHITSTSGMLRYCKESTHKEFIIGTEEGLLHRLRKENPAKQFFILSKEMVCPNMKRTKLDSVLAAMEKMQYVIKVPEDVRIKAKRALDRMLEIM